MPDKRQMSVENKSEIAFSHAWQTGVKLTSLKHAATVVCSKIKRKKKGARNKSGRLANGDVISTINRNTSRIRTDACAAAGRHTLASSTRSSYQRNSC